TTFDFFFGQQIKYLKEEILAAEKEKDSTRKAELMAVLPDNVKDIKGLIHDWDAKGDPELINKLYPAMGQWVSRRYEKVVSSIDQWNSEVDREIPFGKPKQRQRILYPPDAPFEVDEGKPAPRKLDLPASAEQAKSSDRALTQYFQAAVWCFRAE